MTDHHEHRPDTAAGQQDEEGEPDGVRLVVHAAALMLISATYAGIAEVAWRVTSWVRGHMRNGSPWAQRGYDYQRRAFQVIRPWWEAEDRHARRRAAAAQWHAKQPACQHTEPGEHDDEPT